MNESGKIIIVDYQALWAEQFQAMQAIYLAHLDGLAQRVEHIGSTSVPGLAAKPVLDIDIVVKTDQEVLLVLERMTGLGYRHHGDQGVKGREVLKATSERSPDDGSMRVWPRHHLYVCQEEALSLRNHLNLRDYLRANPQKVQEYGALKKKLARQFPNDIDSYVDGKSAFIVEILKKCGLKEKELEEIGGQNKFK